MKMIEKIKISLPNDTYELLKKDCLDFKILKANNEPNMNEFINTLIVNHYEEFTAGEESLQDEIKKALFSVPEVYKKKAFEEIIKIIAKRGAGDTKGQKSAQLSFKPTKSSERAVDYIEAIVIKNESVSSFYRRMMISYSQKTKNEREKIIHRDNYEALEKSISKGVRATIILKNNTIVKGVSVFSVSSSRDELFNYVLGYNGKDNITIRLAGIKSVMLLPDKISIPDENIEMLERQIKCGAQYPIYPSDKDEIKVQLTENGKKLFQKIYLYRPIPTKIEGDVYYFNCSANQLTYYFQRFGDSALILSPKRLGVKMRDYHYFALKKYRTKYDK